MSSEVAIELKLPSETSEENVPDTSKCFRQITPEISLNDNEAVIEEAQSIPGAEDSKSKDDGILATFKMSEDLANIGHIDSSETSDDSPEGPTIKKEAERKRSLSEDRVYIKSRRYGRIPISDRRENDSAGNDATNLISTSPEDEDDDGFSDELALRPKEAKRCSIAHFVEGFDIARRSIKCRHRNINANLDPELDSKVINESSKFLTVPTIQIESSVDDMSAQQSQSDQQLDRVSLRINGSNINLSLTSDRPMSYLEDNFSGIEHRKSLAVSEADDEELVRFHEMAKESQSRVFEGPTVIVDPPSPPTASLDLPDEEADYLRRPSFEFCRKCKYCCVCTCNAQT